MRRNKEAHARHSRREQRSRCRTPLPDPHHGPAVAPGPVTSPTTIRMTIPYISWGPQNTSYTPGTVKVYSHVWPTGTMGEEKGSTPSGTRCSLPCSSWYVVTV